MRIYDPADEERVRTAAYLREWTRSGLVEPAQAAAIDPELRTGLRQTNLALRAVLCLITVMVSSAAIGLFLSITGFRSEFELSITAFIFSALNVAAAEYVIRRFSFYRFGVEEACAVMAAGLFVFAVVTLLERDTYRTPIEWWLAGALVAAAVYARYGPWYAAMASAYCVVVWPAAFELSEVNQRMAAAALALLVFIVAARLRKNAPEEVTRDDFAWLEAAAWPGFYSFVHVWVWQPYQVARIPAPAWWVSYVLIWIVPAIGLVLGFRGRLPWMIRVNGLLAIVTLSTHKQYLGWPSHDWDPILLGALLFTVAVVLRRWLAAGENGQRAGYTASRILMSDKDHRSTISMFGGLKQHGPAPPAPAPAPDSYTPGGGASGGAGASGKF